MRFIIQPSSSPLFYSYSSSSSLLSAGILLLPLLSISSMDFPSEFNLEIAGTPIFSLSSLWASFFPSSAVTAPFIAISAASLHVSALLPSLSAKSCLVFTCQLATVISSTSYTLLSFGMVDGIHGLPLFNYSLLPFSGERSMILFTIMTTPPFSLLGPLLSYCSESPIPFPFPSNISNFSTLALLSSHSHAAYLSSILPLLPSNVLCTDLCSAIFKYDSFQHSLITSANNATLASLSSANLSALGIPFKLDIDVYRSMEYISRNGACLDPFLWLRSTLNLSSPTSHPLSSRCRMLIPPSPLNWVRRPKLMRFNLTQSITSQLSYCYNLIVVKNP